MTFQPLFELNRQSHNESRGSQIGVDFEQDAFNAGYRVVAGVDEVGRGCLAGPVIAAACVLDLGKPLPAGLDDSKKLTEKKRRLIDEEIRGSAVSFAIGRVEAEEIDRINILEATKKAMLEAIRALSPRPDFLLIDAVRLKTIDTHQLALIKGDARSVSIAAASIIAKTFRDDLMREFDREFPQYGFVRHVGYGTSEHLAALREHGPCHLHRKSFRGVLT
jgi:ribonuclease HII